MIAPEQEAVRLRALDLCRVLDTPPECDFDRLVFTASQALRAPIATIAFVDATRAWYKARVGTHISAIPRGESFAAVVVEVGRLTIFEDATNNVRHWHHPLVRREPRVRFYAGMPLFGPSAQPVGAFGVMDRRPRSLPPEQQRLLVMLAREADALLLKRIGPAERPPA
jgi:GAF domain-containing protein